MPSRFGGLFLALVLSLSGAPSQAQAPGKDSAAVLPPAPPRSEPGLKAALMQPIASARVADSLLAQARRQASTGAQVVALAQLASIRLQQQEPAEATRLLQEAERLAPQLRDLRDAGWAMGQVGRIQRRYLTAVPASTDYFAPLSRALGDALGNALPMVLGEKLSKAEQRLKTSDLIVAGTRVPGVEKYRGQGRATPLTPGTPGQPVPVVPEAAYAAAQRAQQELARLKLNVMEKWLDTLLAPGQAPPQVAKQLSASRKRRDSSQALSQAFAKEGDYAQAYRYFLQYSAYKDSLNAEATSRRLAALEYKQTLLRKEAQIQRLTKQQLLRQQAARRQQQYVAGLVGCVAVLIGFAVVLSRNNRTKQLANQQLSEQKATLQQTLAELKNTQNQLIQAEKMASLGELTAGIAHEIQNPLNFVNNFSEVSAELVHELKEARQQLPRDPALEQELLDDVEQNLLKINQHGSRASSIVRGMLEHSRTNAGQKEPTDLNALTEEYAKLAYHGARAKDNSFSATLSTDLDPRLGPVQVVPQEVSRVLMNVFSNAFYAVQKKLSDAPPGYQPEINVCTKREPNGVKIQIRDNGIGIPAALKEKIFQPFFTTKPTGQGTGLGLSLSYDIITKGHGGTFTLESEEGQFTELTLTLPTAAA
ncbi:MAG TPA: ATP-binding protein [Hymenobacter sp.]|jgi:signal transduction histidine kinase|uniref:sensor histidine kinase n=1 Tax=Hymenobacter sp. TaxID=1898978 RepID=UPI002ED83748